MGDSGESTWRRVTEQAIAAAALLLTSVPFALIGLVVWSVLGPPIFFTQTRVGLHKRTFKIQKFRTMHAHHDESGTILPDHLRETLATRLLRRTRLDELPQLLAILRGDMAFVGPRPLLTRTIDEFGELGRLRCRVRPGWTGWAQVNGNTKLTNAQKIALDIWYIDHRNLALDLRILLLTLATIIRGERVVSDRVAASEAYLAARGYAHSAVAEG